jgi:hypothetical protein
MHCTRETFRLWMKYEINSSNSNCVIPVSWFHPARHEEKLQTGQILYRLEMVWRSKKGRSAKRSFRKFSTREGEFSPC